MYSYAQYCESAEYIKDRIFGRKADILLVLGSGLGFIGGLVENPVYIEYGEIPHFKVSTAPDHAGRFVFGGMCGKQVLIMQGRMHCYEGYTEQEVSYPVRVARLCGADSVILTNACGAINTAYNVGDIMLIADHIRLLGQSALTGPNIEQFGPRFCDMTYTYSPEYRLIAKQAARNNDMKLQEGTYFYFPGPQFETPAEIRAARVLGGDVCGMSTVHEATVAGHCGMKVLGLSLVTNMAAGILAQKIDGAEVTAVAEQSKDRFSKLICACVEGF